MRRRAGSRAGVLLDPGIEPETSFSSCPEIRMMIFVIEIDSFYGLLKKMNTILTFGNA